MSLPNQDVEARAPLEGSRRARLGDVLTKRIAAIAAAGVLALLLLIVLVLATGGGKALHKFGPGFFTSTQWRTNPGSFGAAPYHFRTPRSPAHALLPGVPAAARPPFVRSGVSPPPVP